jgi:hypothetical protein
VSTLDSTLVLCWPGDSAAYWAYRGLRQRGIRPLELVHVETLIWNCRWEHRLESQQVSSNLLLADGRMLLNHAIRGVLNRIIEVPSSSFVSARVEDRTYARAEVKALLASWLYALPAPVINRATPASMAGSWRSPSEWLWLAAQAHLPIVDYTREGLDAGDSLRPTSAGLPVGSLRNVIILANRAFGDDVPSEIQAGCVALQRLSGMQLLGISFSVSDEGAWIFVSATPWPDLRVGHDPLLDWLATVLDWEGHP